MTVSTPDIQALIEEANIHRMSVGPNMGIVAADGIHGTPIGDVLAAECDLVQRLAAALSALSGETETEWGNAYIAQAGEVHANLSERDARELARQYPQWRRLVSRAVTFGPWIEVTK